MFDPYREWLGITSGRRPPTHYELLGLPDFEPSAARIHQAAMDRMAQVRRYQLGEYAEIVVRLLGELSQAFDCLSDTDRKRAYDEQLESQTATAETSATVAQTIRTRPWLRRLTRRSWMASLSVAGAAVVVVGVTLAFWQASPTAAPNLAGARHAERDGYLSGPAQRDSGDGQTTALPELVGPRRTGVLRTETSPPLRYFGYSTIGPPRTVQQYADYTNVVLVRGWAERGDATIEAAHAAGLPIVLGVMGKGESERFGKAFGKVMERFEDKVIGVCWFAPYRFGYTPENIAGVGRRIKEQHPRLQYWVAFGDIPRGDYATGPIAPEVDVIMVLEAFDSTPDGVRAKAEQVLPGWRERAGSRPIVWCWTSLSDGEKGLVPRMLPGTFRACLEMAYKHRLEGLMFDRYGDARDQKLVSIDSRPELVQEIRDMAGELGLDRQKAGSVSSR